MSYAKVDAVITGWADAHRLKLNTKFGGEPRRFCYVGSGQHECFQVSVDPPEGEAVTVNAWSVETEDDAELHRRWIVKSDQLPRTLEEALAQISEWSLRPISKRWGAEP